MICRYEGCDKEAQVEVKAHTCPDSILGGCEWEKAGKPIWYHYCWEHMEEYTELDLSSCPYFQGTGYCQSGCTTEPSCETDRPLGGWPSERGASQASFDPNFKKLFSKPS